MGSFLDYDRRDRPESRLDDGQPIHIIQRTHWREMVRVGDNGFQVHRSATVLFPPHRLYKTYQDRYRASTNRMGKAESGDTRSHGKELYSVGDSTLFTSQPGVRNGMYGVQSVSRCRTVVFAESIF